MGVEGPNFYQPNYYIGTPWINQGGDWLDKNGDQQGLVPFAKYTVTTSGTTPTRMTFDAKELVEKLLIENTGIYLARLPYVTQDFASSRNTTHPGPSLSVTTDAGTIDCPLLVDLYLTPSGSAENIGKGSTLGNRVVLKFDLSGISGMVQSATLGITGIGQYPKTPYDIGVYYLAPPIVLTDPIKQMGLVPELGIASEQSIDTDLINHPSVVTYDRFDSHDTVWNGNWFLGAVPNKGTDYPGGDWTYNPEYIPWPEYGINVGRLCIPNEVVNPESTAGFKAFRAMYPATSDPNKNLHSRYSQKGPEWKGPLPRPWQTRWGDGVGPQELYLRFMLLIEDDLWTGMRPGESGGIKLLGFTHVNNATPFAPHEGGYYDIFWSHMVYISHRSSVNPYLFRAGLYCYDHDWYLRYPSLGSAEVLWLNNNFCWQTNRKYSVEVYVKMNTLDENGAGNFDGIYRIWVDGVRMLNIENRKIRNAECGRFSSIPETQFYHGGVAPPVKDVHFQVGAIVVSEEYVGPPRKQ